MLFAGGRPLRYGNRDRGDGREARALLSEALRVFEGAMAAEIASQRLSLFSPNKNINASGRRSAHHLSEWPAPSCVTTRRRSSWRPFRRRRFFSRATSLLVPAQSRFQ